MGKICKIMYKLDGIYGWGTGFYSSDLAMAWHKFWEEYQDEYIDDLETFKVGYMRESSDGNPLIYGNWGTIFCHPESCDGILHTCNCSESENFDYDRKAIFRFFRDKLAPYIKEKTGVDVKITENYFPFTPPYADWIVENKTA